MKDLDAVSLRLLAALVQDGRASHIQLSERIGLSPTACARRQKAMEAEGIILGYQAVVGFKALGLGTIVIVRITLKSQNEESLRAFEAAIDACSSVLRCFLMSGSDDYLIIVVANDIEDFERIHKMQLSRLPHVAHIQSNFALREITNRSYPPIVVSQMQAGRAVRPRTKSRNNKQYL